MMSTKIHAFTLALGLGLAAIMLPAQAAPAREDLVIGQVAPLTGTIAGTGNEYAAGGAAYFAHVHHARGLVGLAGADMEDLRVHRFTQVLRAGVGCQQHNACILQHPVLVEGQHIAGADKPKQHQRFVFGESLTLAPVAREFQTLMAKYQPDKVTPYASMESFIAAKILVEAIRRSGADPKRAKVISQLEKLSSYDVGGFKVSFSPESRVGSKFVKVTVIGRDGKLLR